VKRYAVIYRDAAGFVLAASTFFANTKCEAMREALKERGFPARSVVLVGPEENDHPHTDIFGHSGLWARAL
jgi:hypothetical protein